MESENQVFYCVDDDEYRIYCDICDKLFIEQFYKNHLKSQTHTNKIRKKQQLNKGFNLVLDRPRQSNSRDEKYNNS